MEENFNHSFNNEPIPNNTSNLKVKKDKDKFKLNQTSNIDSGVFHEFEHKSFNATKLQEEFGEIQKELSSSTYNLLIFIKHRL